MKRTMLVVAVAALCVAGSALAQDGSSNVAGQMMGSGNAAGQMMGSGGFTTATQDQWMGNGGRSEDDRQVLGSGMRTEDSGQIVGSGGFTTSTQDQYMGSGGRSVSVGELRLLDGSRVLVVRFDLGTLVISIAE
jgi:hypothetical protein